MANNPNIYNAVIAGATGANQQRWITDPVSGSYATFQAAVVALATVIDDAIAPIAGDASAGQSALMQSIVQGVFADRFVQSNVEASYDSIVGPIIALWTELSAALDPGGGYAPSPGLDTVLFVDPLTAVPEAAQTGSAINPYSTIQAAIDALVALKVTTEVPGTIVLADGDYAAESFTWGNFVAASPEGYRLSLVGYGGAFNIGTITLAGNAFALVRLDISNIGNTNAGGIAGVTVTNGGSSEILFLNNVNCGPIVGAGASSAIVITDCRDLQTIDAFGTLEVYQAIVNGTITNIGSASLNNLLHDSTFQQTDAGQSVFCRNCQFGNYTAAGPTQANNTYFRLDSVFSGGGALYNCRLGETVETIAATGTLFMQDCRTFVPMTITGDLTIHSCVLGDDVACSGTLTIDDSSYQAAINLAGVTITGAPIDISDLPPTQQQIGWAPSAVGQQSSLFTLMPAGHAPGLYEITPHVMVRTAAAASWISATTNWSNGGAQNITVGLGTGSGLTIATLGIALGAGTTSVPRGLLDLFVYSDGISPITLQFTAGGTLAASALLDVYATIARVGGAV